MSKPLGQTRRLRRAGATQFYLFASPMIGHQPALGGAVFPIKGEDPLAAPYLRIDKVTLEIEVGLSRHDGSPFLSAEIPDFSLQPIGVISAPENWLAHDLWNVGIGELNIITVRVDQIGLIGFNDRGGFSKIPEVELYNQAICGNLGLLKTLMKPIGAMVANARPTRCNIYPGSAG
jgi:hypothetical protein